MAFCVRPTSSDRADFLEEVRTPYVDISSSVNSSPEDGTPAFNARAAHEWLSLLHGTSQGWINICSTADWTGRCFSSTEIDQAVQYAAFLNRTGAEGIYVRTTTLLNVPEAHKRGSIEDSMELPGFALDLDIAGPGHKTAELLPPDTATAMSIIEHAGLPEPTVWVHSGGGVYPWWLLEEPYDVSQPSNRIMAEQIAMAFERVTKHAADSLGWHFGVGVRDLARVLRLPGSVNRKKGLARQCQIIEPAGYAFYTANDLYNTAINLIGSLPVEEVAQRPAPKPIQVTDDIKPGDAMELAWDWIDILGPHGWRIQRRLPGGEVRWIRPGKETPGHSASTGRAADRDRLFVLSTDAHPFRCSNDVGPYTKYAAYTLLNHGGDFSAAGRALRGLGFGGERPKNDQVSDLSDVLRPKAAGAASAQVEVVGAEQVQSVEEFGSGSGAAVQVLDVDHVPSLPEVDLGGEQESIVALTVSINRGHIPGLYVRDGELVHVQHKSGFQGNEVIVAPVTADRLNMLLAHHVRTFKYAAVKTGPKAAQTTEYVRRDAAPTLSALRAVVTSNNWPGVPVLTGVIGVPTLRPDGSLIQAPGYDKATGLYLCPTTKIAPVPDKLTDEQVRTSRDFVFRKVFGEFCWASPGDFANYIALLMSPMLRPYVKTTTPFGLITATTPGSGKTNLSDAVGMVYGQSSQVWPARGEELQKKITSILVGNSSPVVVFDNLVEGSCVRSEIIATLVTKTEWDDRLLGASRNVQARNDRLWLATGNGLTVGGDMASRTLLVRLDPRMERPELRRFELGQFSDWILEDGNRAELTYHLIVLVQAWMQAGAAKDTSHTMRGFTKWAQTLGGLLAFHGLEGFLSNNDDLSARDTDSEEWAAFLAKWFELFGPMPKTSKEIHASAQVDYIAGTMMDRWARCFITDENGNTPTTKSLAMMLFGKMDRIYGPYKLVRHKRANDNTTLWYVERESSPDDAVGS